MKIDLRCLTPDDFFSEKEKESFLAIPHSVKKISSKLETISFNTSNYFIKNIKILRVLSPLTINELEESSVKFELSSTCYSYEEGERGLYFKSRTSYQIEMLIRELHKYDEKSAIEMLSNYLSYAKDSFDVISIEEKFSRHLDQLRKYLLKNKCIVRTYDINWDEYKDKIDEERVIFLVSLYEKFGKSINIPAYNDLDYTPFIHADTGDMYLCDISGGRIFVVKNDKTQETQKIYMISKDENPIRFEKWIQEDVVDFLYNHHQSSLMHAKEIKDIHLIGEIKNDKITKATIELTNFDLMQSYIVDLLVSQGKIDNVLPKMTFEELLNNYILQKEDVSIKERAFINILAELKMSGNVLSYEGFSKMGNFRYSNEKTGDFSSYTSKDILTIIHSNRELNLSDLPQEYKSQINYHMAILLKKHDDESTKMVVKQIKSCMDNTSKKLIF